MLGFNHVPATVPNLDSQIAETLRRYDVPGASIAVVRGAEIVWAGGIGSLEAGSDAKVHTDTRFQAASISKCVTALAALRLVEQGKVELDTPGVHPAYAVTLRQLLSNTAGVSTPGFDGYRRGAPIPTVAQILAGEPPANSPRVVIEAPPGTRYKYSGGGFVIAQEIVAGARGEPFATAMAKLVFAPLGMFHSTFEQPLPAGLSFKAATGHDARERPIEGKWHTYPELASGGLWTTAPDIARFVLAIQKAYDGVDGSLISTAMAREMLTPHSPVETTPDRFSCLGLFVSQRAGTFGHFGLNHGYRCRVRATKGVGCAIAIMTNSINGEAIYGPVQKLVDATFAPDSATALAA